MKINTLALAALIGASVYMTLPVSAQSKPFSLGIFRRLRVQLGAIQPDIQLVADQFKSAGIVPVRILFLVRSIHLNAGENRMLSIDLIQLVPWRSNTRAQALLPVLPS